MFDNIITSFNVVAPLFLQMVLGLFLRKIGLLDEHTTKSLNRLIFKVFLPILIFNNIYTTQLESISSVGYIAVTICGIIAVFALLMIFVPIFEKDRRKCGVIIQAGFRSNFVLFGVPVATLLLGSEHTGCVSFLIAIVIPLFNMLAVAELEFFRGNNIDIKKILVGIIKNPLIIGSVIGILVNISGVHLPIFMDSTVSAVSKIATPLALIGLGADFQISAAKQYWKQLVASVALRLVIVPFIILTVAAFLGIRGEEFVAIMIVFSSPVAVNSYIMAEMMDADGTLAAQCVFYSTALSIVSLFFIIFFTKTWGLF